MKKFYLEIDGDDSQSRYEYDSLEEAATYFAKAISDNLDCSLIVVSHEVIGSFRQTGFKNG